MERTLNRTASQLAQNRTNLEAGAPGSGAPPTLLVTRKAQVRKSCVAWIMSSPFLGVHRLLMDPISWIASARASSVWGRCLRCQVHIRSIV